MIARNSASYAGPEKWRSIADNYSKPILLLDNRNAPLPSTHHPRIIHQEHYMHLILQDHRPNRLHAILFLTLFQTTKALLVILALQRLQWLHNSNFSGQMYFDLGVELYGCLWIYGCRTGLAQSRWLEFQLIERTVPSCEDCSKTTSWTCVEGFPNKPNLSYPRK